MLLILRGPAGVGKSATAKILAKRLHARVISIDRILRAHGLDNVQGKSIPAKHFLEANKLALPAIERDLRAGRHVILDGCFYRKAQLDGLRTLSPRVFTLRAPLRSCLERNRTRKQPLADQGVRAVYAMCAKVRTGTPIDATGTATETVRQILRRLPRPEKSTAAS